MQLNADGTWALSFSLDPIYTYPAPDGGEVLVVLSGQMIGSWTGGAAAGDFVFVVDLNSPFTATGTYQGVTLTLTLADLAALSASLGGPSDVLPQTGSCAAGALTLSTGHVYS